MGALIEVSSRRGPTTVLVESSSGRGPTTVECDGSSKDSVSTGVFC